MKIKSWMKAPAVLLLGVGLTLAMPVAAAVGDGSSPSTAAIRITTTKVALLANGLAVEIPVRYICTGGETPSISVQISAVSHKMIVTASTQFNGQPCTGAFQHVTAILAVQGQRFKPGPALAQASIFSCPFFCGTATDAQALQLM